MGLGIAVVSYVEDSEPPASTRLTLLQQTLLCEESGEERQVLRFVEWSSRARPKGIGKQQLLDVWLWMTEPIKLPGSRG